MKTEIFERICCPLCKGQDYTVLRASNYQSEISDDFFETIYRSSSNEKLFDQLVRCGHCELVFVNPRPKADLIINSYEKCVDTDFVAQDKMRINTFKANLIKISEIYDIKPDRTKKILDVGCAGGAFLKAAEDLGFNAIGVEPNRWLCKHGREQYGVDIRQGTLLDHKFSPSSFDIISLWDVIEHLPNPDAVLNYAHKLLKDNGLMIVNYPDYKSTPAKLMGNIWPFLLSVHLVYYTSKTIKLLLESNGFEIIKTYRHWQTLELGYVIKRASAYISFLNQMKKMTDKFHLSALPLKYFMGQIQVVVRKKHE